MSNQPVIGSAHRQTSGPSKIKVRVGEVGLVIPVGNPNDKVERLLRDIAARFEGFGVKPGQLRLAELTTYDGYIISPHDLIKDVLSDGDALRAVDFETWSESQAPLCKDQWLDVIRKDIVADDYKWIIVGKHEYNKLFIKYGKNYPGTQYEKMIGLELYDMDSLQHFAKDGKVLAFSKEDKEKDSFWKLEAFFNVTKGVAKEIEISVKSASDGKPVIKKLELKYDRFIDKGAETIVQDDKDRYNPASYKLPSGSKTGPVLSDAVGTKKETPMAKGSGHPTLQITQANAVEVNQNWYSSSSESFTNYFISNFVLLNNGPNRLAITKVAAAYQAKDGKWIDQGLEFHTGSRRGFLDYYFTDAQGFTMDSKQQMEYCISIGITIKSDQFEVQRRAHKSLPQPFKIKYTFEDSDGKKGEIIVEQNNKPLELVTRASREKYLDKKVDLYAQCDDDKLEVRIFTHVLHNKEEKRLEIALGSSSSKYFYIDDAKALAFQGVKEKKEEVQIEDKYEEKGCSVILSGLIDLKNSRCYALKIALKTSTSTVTEYFLLPILDP